MKNEEFKELLKWNKFLSNRENGKDDRELRKAIGNAVDEDMFFFPVYQNGTYVKVDSLDELTDYQKILVKKSIIKEFRAGLKMINRAKRKFRFLDEQLCKELMGELIR